MKLLVAVTLFVTIGCACAQVNNEVINKSHKIFQNCNELHEGNAECLSLCLLEKVGLVDANGNPNIEAITASAKTVGQFLGKSSESVTAIVAECTTQKGTGACNSGSLIYACFNRYGFL